MDSQQSFPPQEAKTGSDADESNKSMENDDEPEEDEPEIDYYEDINDIARLNGFDIDEEGHRNPLPDW